LQFTIKIPSHSSPTPTARILPFGESYVDQRSSGFGSRYQFSAKEKDAESGYHYFGARYYDSDLSVWLSVDPLADKYPSTSSYMYCLGNPIVLIDPDGRSASPILDEEGNLLGTDNQGWTGTAIVMNKNDFKQDMDHNDALNKGTELNLYSKGINISNETW
jgi:RHS repeat-associated protein